MHKSNLLIIIIDRIQHYFKNRASENVSCKAMPTSVCILYDMFFDPLVRTMFSQSVADSERDMMKEGGRRGGGLGVGGEGEVRQTRVVVV